MREDKDQAFIVHFDTEVETLQRVTSSLPELESALGRLTIPEGAATLLYSAVRDSSENVVMTPLAGRKAFILLTDGIAFREPTSIASAIEFARADTMIYSIRFSERQAFYHPLRVAAGAAAKEFGRHELNRMAEETGGVSYAVTKSQSIEAIYLQIEEALLNQYSIGNTPRRKNDDGRYHRIKLTTKDRHLVVHTRDGYYAR